MSSNPLTISTQALFHTFYGWDSAHTGVALSVSTTVGGVLGEIVAGPVTDKLMRSARKRANGKVKPESRLHAMWSGFTLMPIGLVIFGAMLRFHSIQNSWVGACIAMGVTCFAVQVITTPVRRNGLLPVRLFWLLPGYRICCRLLQTSSFSQYPNVEFYSSDDGVHCGILVDSLRDESRVSVFWSDLCARILSVFHSGGHYDAIWGAY